MAEYVKTSIGIYPAGEDLLYSKGLAVGFNGINPPETYWQLPRSLPAVGVIAIGARQGDAPDVVIHGATTIRLSDEVSGVRPGDRLVSQPDGTFIKGDGIATASEFSDGGSVMAFINLQSYATNTMVPGQADRTDFIGLDSGPDSRDGYFRETGRTSQLFDGKLIRVVGGTTVTRYIWNGGDQPPTYDSDQWLSTSEAAGPGTFIIGAEGAELSSALCEVNLSSADGRKALVIRSIYDDSGSYKPSYWKMGQLTPFDVNTNNSATLPPDVSVSLPSTESALATVFYVWPETGGDIRVRSTVTAGNVLGNMPLVVDNLFRVADSEAGAEVRLPIPNPTLAKDGITQSVRFSGVALRGRVTSGEVNLPYLRAEVQTAVSVDLLTEDDVSNEAGKLMRLVSVDGNAALVAQILANTLELGDGLSMSITEAGKVRIEIGGGAGGDASIDSFTVSQDANVDIGTTITGTKTFTWTASNYSGSITIMQDGVPLGSFPAASGTADIAVNESILANLDDATHFTIAGAGTNTRTYSVTARARFWWGVSATENPAGILEGSLHSELIVGNELAITYNSIPNGYQFFYEDTARPMTYIGTAGDEFNALQVYPVGGQRTLSGREHNWRSSKTVASVIYNRIVRF